MQLTKQLSSFSLTFKDKLLEEEFSQNDHQMLTLFLLEEDFNILLIVFCLTISILGLVGKFYQKFLPLCNAIMQALLSYFLTKFVIDFREKMPTFQAFMNGQVTKNHLKEIASVGSVFLLGSRSFLFDSLSLLASQCVIIWICDPPVRNYLDFIQVALLNLITKYIYYLYARQSFIKQKSIDQWYSAIDSLFQNSLIITKFEPRTCNISLHECNEYARRLNIHKSPDDFRTFLGKITLCQKKKIPPQKHHIFQKDHHITLREYLLEKYAQVVTQKTESLKKKEKGEEFVCFFEKDKEIIKVRVKIGLLLQEEPFLIISFNDRLDEENINFMKKEGLQLRSIFKLLILNQKNTIMKLCNSISTGCVSISREISLSLYIQICSINEYLQNLTSNHFKREVNFHQIQLRNLLDLVHKIYPRIEVIAEGFVLSTTIISDLSKLKLVLLAVCSVFSKNQQKQEYPFPKDIMNKSRGIQENIYEDLTERQNETNSLIGNHDKRDQNYFSEQQLSNRIQLLKGDTCDIEKEENFTELRVEIKQNSLFQSVKFTIKGQSHHQQNHQGQKQPQQPQDIYQDVPVLREIENECVRYYLALLGPENKSFDSCALIKNDSQQIEFEFEVFTDLRTVRETQHKSVSQRNQMFSKPKSNSDSKAINSHIVFDRQRVTSSPSFRNLCKEVTQRAANNQVHNNDTFSRAAISSNFCHTSSKFQSKKSFIEQNIPTGSQSDQNKQTKKPISKNILASRSLFCCQRKVSIEQIIISQKENSQEFLGTSLFSDNKNQVKQMS